MLKSITDLVPDNKNANRGTARGRKAVRDSRQKLGAGRSIVVDRNGRIIAGNKTAEGAKAAGLENVIAVETDGSQLVAVIRTDLDLDDPKARELAIADNRTAELGLEWDGPVLKDLAADLDLKPYFTDEELKELLPPDPQQEQQNEEDTASLVDQAEQLREKWQTALGQVWEIPSAHSGRRHRLMCGSSTNRDDVSTLLAGVCPRLMVTDPPYGVSYDPDWRLEAGINKPWQTLASGKVANDDRADWTAAWEHFPGDVAYVWHGALHSRVVAESLDKQNFKIRSQIIWAKPTLVMGRGHYHWQHEPCFYAVRDGKTSEWAGDRKQTTLWEIANMHRTQGDVDDGKTFHSTQKPVECMARPMRNHFDAGCEVYDPFIGSGTTLVAAEQTGRIAYGMEIEPKYVAVALERLTNLGLQPRLTDVR